MEAEELALQVEALTARKDDVATKLRQPGLSTEDKVALEEEYVLLLRAKVALDRIERSLQTEDATVPECEPEREHEPAPQPEPEPGSSCGGSSHDGTARASH